MMTSPYSIAVFQAFGWMILHSLWQILLVWLVFQVFIRLFSKNNTACYSGTILLLFIVTAWSGYTFWSHLDWPEMSTKMLLPTGETVHDLPEFTAENPIPEAVFAPDWKAAATTWLNSFSPWLGLVWLVVSITLLLRLAGGWYVANVLKTRAVKTVAEDLQNLCANWCQKMGIHRKVQILESPHIPEPLTLGFWKPVILFPVGMATQLPPDQLELLLLHELAHIRRADYLVNLFQLILESLFFYHPLFRHISNAARKYREFACDDAVISRTEIPLIYARTLTDLKRATIHHLNNFAMKTLGKNEFEQRIMRIAGVHPRKGVRPHWLLLLLIPMLIHLSFKEQAATPAALNTTIETIAEPISYSTPINALAVKSKRPEKQPVITVAAPAIDSSAPTVVSIAPEKMNVLYIGVDNPVTIAVPGLECGDFEVAPSSETQGVTLIKVGDCKYHVRATVPGKAVIEVYDSKDGQRKLLGSNTFRIKRIPDPTPLVGGYASRKISWENFSKCTGVEAVLRNFDYDAACEVISYQVTVLLTGQDPSSEFTVYGDKFDSHPKIKQLFDQIPEIGAQVFFDNIMVTCPGDSNPRNLGGLAFSIKKAEPESHKE